MIIVVRRNNIILITLIFLLLVMIYSLNVGADEVSPAVTDPGQQRTVILDPGHGGEDPGTVSDYSGVKEKDLNLKIALKVKQLLENEGFSVLMTREEDVLQYQPDTTNITEKRKQDLLKRKKLMDEGGADIVVSMHMNKFGQAQYYGAQTFYPPGSAESQKLATCIQKSLKELVDTSNKRVSMEKKEPIIIMKDYKTPTVLVECGFLSNMEEEKKLRTDEYQEKIADAIKEGVKQYFK